MFRILKAKHGSINKFLMISVLMLGGMHTPNAMANGKVKWETLEVGGVGNVRFTDENHGYASSGAGTWAALSFEVTSQEAQNDGSIIATMLHDFVTPIGGWVKTEDVVILRPIIGNSGVFSIEVTYEIFEGGNGMEGYEGQTFNSRGFIDTNESIASVRYTGKIRRKVKGKTIFVR